MDRNNLCETAIEARKFVVFSSYFVFLPKVLITKSSFIKSLLLDLSYKKVDKVHSSQRLRGNSLIYLQTLCMAHL